MSRSVWRAISYQMGLRGAQENSQGKAYNFSIGCNIVPITEDRDKIGGQAAQDWFNSQKLRATPYWVEENNVKCTTAAVDGNKLLSISICSEMPQDHWEREIALLNHIAAQSEHDVRRSRPWDPWHEKLESCHVNGFNHVSGVEEKSWEISDTHKAVEAECVTESENLGLRTPHEKTLWISPKIFLK